MGRHQMQRAETTPPPPNPPVASALPEVYLVTKRYCFTRNHAMVILPAGKLYYRSLESALIDDALKIGAPLTPINPEKLHTCPHCKGSSLLK